MTFPPWIVTVFFRPALHFLDDKLENNSEQVSVFGFPISFHDSLAFSKCCAKGDLFLALIQSRPEPFRSLFTFTGTGVRFFFKRKQAPV